MLDLGASGENTRLNIPRNDSDPLECWDGGGASVLVLFQVVC